MDDYWINTYMDEKINDQSGWIEKQWMDRTTSFPLNNIKSSIKHKVCISFPCTSDSLNKMKKKSEIGLIVEDKKVNKIWK